MYFDCLSIDDVIGFEWNEGNIYKKENKYGLKWQLIEEIFFNEPLLVFEDIRHSQDECRCFSLGFTDDKVHFFVVFTKREQKIRVISARKINKKERKIYENFKKDS